jgi:hypothetical protein
MTHTVLAEPGHKSSVQAFVHYWKAPYTPRAMPVTADVVGHWPRPIGVVRGADDYVSVIATILEVCPDFRLTVPEHAATDDLTFLRWIATGTRPDGRFEFNGCDRVRTRDGHVCENYIFCDDPFFARVATASGRARRVHSTQRSEVSMTVDRRTALKTFGVLALGLQVGAEAVRPAAAENIDANEMIEARRKAMSNVNESSCVICRYGTSRTLQGGETW